MLKACANAGDSQAAEQLYQSMLSRGLSCLLVAYFFRIYVRDASVVVELLACFFLAGSCPSSPVLLVGFLDVL